MADSKITVYGAIAANVAIAVTKFIVAAITGSSAMLSEGIHSAVDTCNGVLLLTGMRLSHRPATDEHPFGHGKELILEPDRRGADLRPGWRHLVLRGRDAHSRAGAVAGSVLELRRARRRLLL